MIIPPADVRRDMAKEVAGRNRIICALSSTPDQVDRTGDSVCELFRPAHTRAWV